jgi:plastocyanin
VPKISRVTFLTLAAFALVAFAGCGDEEKPADKTTPPPLSSDLKLEIEGKGDDAKFDKQQLDAKPGTVKITVSNPQDSGEKHGIAIDGGDYSNVEGVPVAPGRQTSLTVTLKPGKYTYYDSAKKFKDDKDLRGTITVEKSK